jgi:hypothetical protein
MCSGAALTVVARQAADAALASFVSTQSVRCTCVLRFVTRAVCAVARRRLLWRSAETRVRVTETAFVPSRDLTLEATHAWRECGLRAMTRGSCCARQRVCVLWFRVSARTC